MTDLIFDYMRNLTAYLIIDIFLGIIVPQSKYKKYISLISGLILVLILIAPINKFSQISR
jgi:hypothetical protein